MIYPFFLSYLCLFLGIGFLFQFLLLPGDERLERDLGKGGRVQGASLLLY